MISAIIVNHNGESDLRRCLESLEASSCELEILLVDNASEDDSLKLVREEFPAVQVMAQERNLGFAASNNLAAASARGSSLLLLNTDAWLVEDCARSLLKRLESQARIGLVAPRLRYGDGRRQFSWSPERGVLGEILQRLRNPWEARAWTDGPLFRGLARLAGPPWYTAACVLIRTEAFQSVGGFDERYFMYFEDVDLCRRMGKAGWRLVQEGAAFAGHDGGLQKGPAPRDFYRPSQLRYYRLHRPACEARYVERRLRKRFGDRSVEEWIHGGSRA